jgi:hypothetical protein
MQATKAFTFLYSHIAKLVLVGQYLLKESRQAMTAMATD